MARISKNPQSKKWTAEIRWRDGTGKRLGRSRGDFVRKADAEMWAAQQQALVDSGHADKSKLTVGVFWDEWLRMFDRKVREGKRSPTTLDTYRHDIKKLRPHLGSMKIQAVRPVHIEDALDELEGKPRTIDRAYRTARASFTYGVKIGVITSNPALHIERPQIEAIEYSVYTSEMAVRLLQALREQRHILYLPVVMALGLGLRRGEAFGATWSNTDLKNATIKICTSKTYADGSIIERDTVKSTASKATLPMPPFVVDALKDEKKRQMAAGHLSQYICNASSDTIIHASAKLQRFQAANGLPACRFHDLRHTTASLLHDQGVPIEIISALLRHSNAQITQNIYVHVFDNKKREAINKVQDIFAK